MKKTIRYRVAYMKSYKEGLAPLIFNSTSQTFWTVDGPVAQTIFFKSLNKASKAIKENKTVDLYK